MAKEFNLNNVKKSFLPVRFRDNKLVIVGMPTKKLFDDLKTIGDTMDNIGDAGERQIDELYRLLASVISNNKTGKKVTKEYLEDQFSLEDAILFFYSYVDFISELTNQKN